MALLIPEEIYLAEQERLEGERRDDHVQRLGPGRHPGRAGSPASAIRWHLAAAPATAGGARTCPTRPPGPTTAFWLDGGEPLPDPRSPRQPAGVNGPSRALRPGRVLLDRRQLAAAARCTGSVIYELHVGTFTAEGTFDAAIGRLDYLAELGVTWSS